MAIAFRAAAAAGSNGDTQVTINKPTGTVDGDILIASIYKRNAAAITPPTGWTFIRTVAQGATDDVNLYWKRASGEGTTYQWTWTGSNANRGTISSWPGCVATGDPVDVENGQANASGLSAASPDITTTVGNAMVVFVGHTTPGAGYSDTWTPPSGMTEGIDTSGLTHPATVAYVLQASAGATGVKTATLGHDEKSVVFLLALKPPPILNLTGGSARL